jgi:hypothetical protein
VGGEPHQAFDILDVNFFSQNSIPDLSLHRVLPQQIDLMFDYLYNPEKQAYID